MKQIYFKEASGINDWRFSIWFKFFQHKFNYTWSGNVFKRLKCFQLFYKWYFTESSMIMSFLRSCKTVSTSPSQPGAIRSITIPWWALMVVNVAIPSYASKINFRKQISLRSMRRYFFRVSKIKKPFAQFLHLNIVSIWVPLYLSPYQLKKSETGQDGTKNICHKGTKTQRIYLLFFLRALVP